MRPPISSNKNDGVQSTPSHRKTQINQKEILAENQNFKNRPNVISNPAVVQLTPTTPSATATTAIINHNSSNPLIFGNIVVPLGSPEELLTFHPNGQQKFLDEIPSTSANVEIYDIKSYSKPNNLDNFSNTNSANLLAPKLTNNHNNQLKTPNNSKKLKRLSSDVSDNRIKNRQDHPNRISYSNFVSANHLVNSNSNLDSSLNDSSSHSNSSTNSSDFGNYFSSSNNSVNVPNSFYFHHNNLQASLVAAPPPYANYNHHTEPIRPTTYYYQTDKDCSGDLIKIPISETEPLLTNIETTISDTNPGSEICLNKNSASLIFTKKDLNNIKSKNSSSDSKNSNSTSFIDRRSTIGANNCSNSSGLINKKIAAGNKVGEFKNNFEISLNQIEIRDEEKLQNRKSFPSNYSGNFSSKDNRDSSDNSQRLNQSTTAANRKQLAYSWYAPVYSALEEEIEQDSRDSSPIHNLANIKNKNSNSQLNNTRNQPVGQDVQNNQNLQIIPIEDNETQSLLENNKNQINIQPQLHQITNQRVRRHGTTTVATPLPIQEQHQHPNTFPSNLAHSINNNHVSQTNIAGQNDTESPPNTTTNQQQSLLNGGPIPRRRRFENFLKTLVGRKPSKEPTVIAIQSQQQQPNINTTQPQLPSPEITITHSPSEDFGRISFSTNGMVDTNSCSGAGSPNNYNSGSTFTNDQSQITHSTLSLNTVQQKIWNFVPLLRREGSAASLFNEKSNSIVQYTGLRKCETVLALSRQSSTYSQIPNGIIEHGRRSVPGITYNRSVSSNNTTNGQTDRNANSRASAGNFTEPIKPLNRLRNSVSTTNANCSRCSSLLSLAASGSRYSLNIANNGNLSISNTNANTNSYSNNNNYNNNNRYSNDNKCNLNNSNNYDNNINGSCTGGSFVESLLSSRKNSNSNGIVRNESIGSNSGCYVDNIDGIVLGGTISPPLSAKTDTSTTATLNSTITQLQSLGDSSYTCKLCLTDVNNNSNDSTTIAQCGCSFCTECMRAYVEFEISEGAYEISCPDAQCPGQGIINLVEITSLASVNSIKNHHRYRLNREIELDKTRTWCPRAGCETICLIGSPPSSSSSPTAVITTAAAAVSTTNIATASSSTGPIDDKVNSITTLVLCSVQCPTCRDEFCSGCKKPWHPNISCEENNRRLAADGQDDSIGIPFDNDLIKCCPMCAVPIEKDEGCAQMMCKRCKHVFCWYCLASLDDDFLLRHYDKGPCKNKLGHSRASVVWHRAQVIGIFAGFGILLLVASPLLLLAAPCIICCKCRICSGSNTKLDDPDTDFDDAIALQR